jgi:hypothetical protein
LGDWYANLLFTRCDRLVLVLSARSLLSVLLPANGFGNFMPRLRSSLERALATLGAPPLGVVAELREMQQAELGRTISRNVLGSMIDLAYQVRVRLEDEPSIPINTIELELSQVPLSYIGYRYPADVAVVLMSGRGPNPSVHRRVRATTAST